jgi:hypothetical protein
VVVLPKAALAQLKTHRAKQGKERLLLGAGYQDEDLIFARSGGTPWPPSQFSSEFARLPASVASASAFTIFAIRTLPIC